MEEARESRVEPGVAVNERYVYSATCSKILLLSYRKARWMENKLQGRVCVPVRSTEWKRGMGEGEERWERRRKRRREQAGRTLGFNYLGGRPEFCIMLGPRLQIFNESRLIVRDR